MESTFELTIVKGRTHTYTLFPAVSCLLLESLTGGSLQDKKRALDLEGQTPALAHRLRPQQGLASKERNPVRVLVWEGREARRLFQRPWKQHLAITQKEQGANPKYREKPRILG